MNQNRQVQNYYFPVKDFFIERTDLFVNSNDTADKVIWRMKTYLSNSDTLFQTLIFDKDDRMIDSIVETVSNGNAVMKSYTLYDYPDGKRVESICAVSGSEVFRPNQNIGESIKWKVRFKDYLSSDMCELSKSRKLMSDDPDRERKVFSDKMEFINTKTNQGYQYEATMLYQKGTGLISYSMILPDGKEKHYALLGRK